MPGVVMTAVGGAVAKQWGCFRGMGHDIVVDVQDFGRVRSPVDLVFFKVPWTDRGGFLSASEERTR